MYLDLHYDDKSNLKSNVYFFLNFHFNLKRKQFNCYFLWVQIPVFVKEN